MIKHYVEFFYPGIFFSESSSREVAERVPRGEFPDGSFGCRFFDREAVKGDHDDWLYGSPFNYSGIYYRGGTDYTLKEVKAFFPNEDILISNMEANGYEKVIKTSMGNWQPFTDKDTILY